MIRRRMLVVAALGVFLAGVAGCGKEEPKTAPSGTASTGSPQTVTVKIGLAAPLTGPQAHIGEDIRNGSQLAVDDFNATGTVIDGKRVQFEMVPEDDEANPTKATTVAQALVDAKVVGVVGHFNSGASIPASRIYSDAGIPQISPSSTNPAYTQQGFKTTFRVVANDNQQGPVLARFALDRLHGKTIAVIDDSTAYGQGLADTFEAAAKAGGARIVAREHTTDKDTDFKAILTKIKGEKPDVIMFGGVDPQGGPMVKQMVQLGIAAKFMGGDGIQTPNFIRLAGEKEAEGVYASMPGLPKDKMPGGRQFVEKYKAKYNKEVELFAPMGYDAVFVLAEAMKRADSVDPAKFLPEVGRTHYNGIIGPIAFDDKGDLKNGPLTVYVVKEGTWDPVETLVSGEVQAAAAESGGKPDVPPTEQKAAGAGK